MVLDVLRRVPKVRRLVVMIQREVAERFVACPGSKAYGLPSVVCRLYANATLAFRVPPQVFVPVPRVESAVVVLDRKESDRMAEAAIGLAEAGFGQRRKMLRRSLQQVIADPDIALEKAGIEPTARAEELSADDFVRIAEVVDA